MFTRRQDAPRTSTRARAPFQRALLAALILSLSLAAPAAAVARYATPANPYWMQFGVFGYWVYFGASWDISSTQDAGRSWWVVKTLQMSGSVDNGKLCINNGTCAGHWFENKAQFLNAAGQVVKTVVNTGAACGPVYSDPSDVGFTYCTRGPMQISKSVTKIKFTWRMHVTQIFPGIPWSTQLVTKTVNIL